MHGVTLAQYGHSNWRTGIKIWYSWIYWWTPSIWFSITILAILMSRFTANTLLFSVFITEKLISISSPASNVLFGRCEFINVMLFCMSLTSQCLFSNTSYLVLPETKTSATELNWNGMPNDRHSYHLYHIEFLSMEIFVFMRCGRMFWNFIINIQRQKCSSFRWRCRFMQSIDCHSVHFNGADMKLTDTEIAVYSSDD